MAVLTKRKNISKSKSNYKTRKQFKRFRKSVSNIRKMKGGAGVPNTTIPEVDILENFREILNNNEYEYENLINKIEYISDINMKKQFQIIIILGAHSSEEHIKQFVNLRNNSIVICFATLYTASTSELTNMNINKANNSVSISFVADFNDIKIWEELNKKLKINTIICDWSVSKFLRNEYNFICGKIMAIIMEILVENGTYYSSCCYSMMGVTKEKNSTKIKKTPMLDSYAYVPLKQCIKGSRRNNYNNLNIKTEHIAEEWNDLLPYVDKNTHKVYNITEYINKYKNHLDYYKPTNSELTFTTSTNKANDYYPLPNIRRINYPNTYFCLKKVPNIKN